MSLQAILPGIQIRLIWRAVAQISAETGRLVGMSQVYPGRMKPS